MLLSAVPDHSCELAFLVANQLFIDGLESANDITRNDDCLIVDTKKGSSETP